MLKIEKYLWEMYYQWCRKRIDEVIEETLGMSQWNLYQHTGYQLPEEYNWRKFWKEGCSVNEAIEKTVGPIWDPTWQAYLSAELHGV